MVDGPLMSDPDTALRSLAAVLAHPLDFDDDGQCALEFEGERLVVLQRSGEAGLSIRIAIQRVDSTPDAQHHLTLMARALAENYRSGPEDGVIGLCEASQSLVLVRWLTDESMTDLVEAIAHLIERAESVETALVDSDEADTSVRGSLGIRV
jgi:hypothetical protein